MQRLTRYSIGIGDRFAHEGRAQLGAIQEAWERGIRVTPVWNKSHREHTIVGSDPMSVREEADRAVAAMGWRRPYFVDADHISAGTVELFLEASDFFTIDVAEAIGKPAPPETLERYEGAVAPFIGELSVPGIQGRLTVGREDALRTGQSYARAVEEAAATYRRIERAKGPGAFVAEVSMDETEAPQSPVDLLLVLAGLAGFGVRPQTIAPRFSGRFNKGVDYVGEVGGFETEFARDAAVIRYAQRELDLDDELKLSIHSGSDKFSIYPCIRRVLEQTGSGVHLKTAGTTWLEEIVGLAEAGGEGLAIAREIYRQAYARRAELCGPYAAVIDIDPSRLPEPAELAALDGATVAATVRHDPSCAVYNPHVRQLLHVGYRVAAEMGERFLRALRDHRAHIERNVRQNILQRHVLAVFPAEQ